MLPAQMVESVVKIGKNVVLVCQSSQSHNGNIPQICKCHKNPFVPVYNIININNILQPFHKITIKPLFQLNILSVFMLRLGHIQSRHNDNHRLPHQNLQWYTSLKRGITCHLFLFFIFQTTFPIIYFRYVIIIFQTKHFTCRIIFWSKKLSSTKESCTDKSFPAQL